MTGLPQLPGKQREFAGDDVNSVKLIEPGPINRTRPTGAHAKQAEGLEECESC